MNFLRRFIACGFVSAISVIGMSAGGQPKLPDYYPQCGYPVLLTPPQPSGGSKLLGKVAAAWTGTEYGTAYADANDAKLYFRRMFADGSPDGPPSVIAASAYAYAAPGLVWTGTEFGFAWLDSSDLYYRFQRLTAAGVPIGSATQVSNAPVQTLWFPSSVGLSWSGSGYAAVWQDSRNNATNSVDVFATLLNPDGSIAGPSAAWHDIAVASLAAQQHFPTVAWSPVAAQYLIVWRDARSGKSELWESLLNPADGTASANALLVTSAGNAFFPSLVSAGNGLGLVWNDNRDGNDEIYFARLNNAGEKIGADVRLTNDAALSEYPAIAWTGAEYGVFWEDHRSGNPDIWFQRVSATGTLLGGNQQVSFSADLSLPSPAFAQYGYLFFASPFQSFTPGPAQAQALACNYDYDAPSCPQNLVAYNITGSTATIGWIPSVENDTDIAYYEVYRNSARQALTSATVYSDSGLGLSSTYNYYIRPVNAAQMANGGCTNSVYVKTNASLTLTMGKSDANAQLNWTDGGLNSYNIFRGTNPQVMSQIGATPTLTAQDANVLADSVSYFYTVDDPGQ